MRVHHYPMPRQGCDRIRYMASFNYQLPKKSGEIRQWCIDTYGAPGCLPQSTEIRWLDDIKYGEIVFQREADLMLFLLRWS